MLETTFKDIPENLHMMQHVYRSQYSQHAKCIFNTETILTVQQHFIQDCIGSGQCGVDYVHGGVGQYRLFLLTFVKNCYSSKITTLPQGLPRLSRLWGQGVHQWPVRLQGYRRQRDGHLEAPGAGGQQRENRPGQHWLWMKPHEWCS